MLHFTSHSSSKLTVLSAVDGDGADAIVSSDATDSLASVCSNGEGLLIKCPAPAPSFLGWEGGLTPLNSPCLELAPLVTCHCTRRLSLKLVE